MKKVSLVIVEDEKLAAKALARKIKELEPDFEILAMLHSLSQAVEWFSQNPEPDLVFLDIQLSDGVSFEIFEKTNLQTDVIFTTAYNEYALQAFKLHSIDYLLKPISQADLQFAIEKWKKWRNQPEKENLLVNNLQNLLAQMALNEKKLYKKRFLVHSKNSLVPIEVKDIACFYKQELIFAHTFEGQNFITEHQTLDEIEALIDPKLFFRANRQYIVHIQNINSLRNTYKGAEISLFSPKNTFLDISREKVGLLKEWLNR
ncbi:MAG: LytTR family DNA-binding domain-containing protein [Raineya sp.]